jgi:hypothetical protein
MGIHWSQEKSEQLKPIRGVSFEDVIQAEFVGTTDHPAQPNQTMLFFRIEDHIWAVPCVILEGEIFLKTLYPSRKHTRLWRLGELS